MPVALATVSVGAASGTSAQTSGGSASVLAEIATAGTFTLHIDLSLRSSNDTIEIRILQKILSAGALRIAYYQFFSGVQPTDNQLQISVPIANDLVEAASLRFTIQQPTGTARALPYKVISY